VLAVAASRGTRGSRDLCLAVAPRVVQVAERQPSVQVWSNGISAACGDLSVSGDEAVALGEACHYSYLDAATPHVTAVSASVITVGTQLVITGTGFGPTVKDNRVLIGDMSPCTLTSASSTELRCTVEHSPAGEASVLLLSTLLAASSLTRRRAVVVRVQASTPSS
jgi:hypothetical protein